MTAHRSSTTENHPTLSHNDTHVEFSRLLAHGNASIPWSHIRQVFRVDHNLGAAGQWLAEQIKTTNGHTQYVAGLVAHIARFEHPLLGAQALFDWWKKERVPTMEESDFVKYDSKADRQSRIRLCVNLGVHKRITLRRAGATTTITLMAAQRLLQFVRDHRESLDVPSEYLQSMTYQEGCDALANCLPQDDGPATPLPIFLAYVIQCFAGVAYEQRVKGVEEKVGHAR